MVEKQPRRIGRIVKLVVFSLLPAIVLVVIMETVATISTGRNGEVVRDSVGGHDIYTMRIGGWPWSRKSVTPLNSLGYADAEFPAAGAPKQCRHVVVAGDSYVFGDGVDGDSNFVSIVRRQAMARPGAPCVRIFNIGVRGSTIDKQTDRILQTIDRLQPDVVIVGQYQNDLTDLTNPGGFLDPNKAAASQQTRHVDSIRVTLSIMKLNTVRWLTYQAFGFMISNGIQRDELRHWSVMANPDRQGEAKRYQETYGTLFAQLVDSLAARRVAFGVIILPSKLDVLAKRYPEESFFVGLAERHRLPHLRLFPAFDATRKPYAYLMYDGHLNEQGNRLVAGELYRWLFEAQPAPFPILQTPVAPPPAVPTRRG